MSSPVRKAAAICYRLNEAAHPEFLLVRNKSNTQWIFPKGTVEVWEPYGHLAARREAWEEAGARGNVEPRKLGTFRHVAKFKKSTLGEVQHIEAYLMRVTDTAGNPEPGRQPTWFTLAEAHLALMGRMDLPSPVGAPSHMLQLACAWVQAGNLSAG